jgi:hypothetical protein
MIANLLKELPRALGRYVAYQASRVMPGGKKMGDAAAPPRPNHATGEHRTDDGDIGLDPSYERLVAWPTYRRKEPPPEVVSQPLYGIWNKSPGGHKWPHYFAAYEAVFGPNRTKPLRIMEIGVLEGASLRMWKEYFSHPDTVIVGIDIEPNCIRYDAPSKGIRVRIGSQTDGSFLKSVTEEFGPFDLIIDDGSHRSSHIIKSFNHLFADALKDSGIYLVEDLHANYWSGWRDSHKTILDVCKEIVEHMHAHYRRAPAEAFLVADPDQQRFDTLDVPVIATMIEEIRFFDSIIAIQKTRRAYVPHYMLSG